MVSDRWRSFKNFLADMGECPHGLSIERIDNEKGYFAENCRWATRLEQNRNSRHNTRLTHNGITLAISEWAERMGVDPVVLRNRKRYGWSVAKILDTPVQKYRKRKATTANNGA